MKCPICKARNVTAAHIQGHACKGSPKTLTPEQREQRRQQAVVMNAKRRQSAAMPLPATP